MQWSVSCNRLIIQGISLSELIHGKVAECTAGELCNFQARQTDFGDLLLYREFIAPIVADKTVKAILLVIPARLQKICSREKVEAGYK